MDDSTDDMADPTVGMGAEAYSPAVSQAVATVQQIDAELESIATTLREIDDKLTAGGLKLKERKALSKRVPKLDRRYRFLTKQRLKALDKLRKIQAEERKREVNLARTDLELAEEKAAYHQRQRDKADAELDQRYRQDLATPDEIDTTFDAATLSAFGLDDPTTDDDEGKATRRGVPIGLWVGGGAAALLVGALVLRRGRGRKRAA